MAPRLTTTLVGTALAAVLTVVTGCGEASSTAEVPGEDTTGGIGRADLTGDWLLVGGRDGRGALPLRNRYPVTLHARGTEAVGSSGCNSYTTEVRYLGDRVRFGPVGGTEMGCAPGVMRLEARYAAALASVTAVDRSADTLLLTGPSVELSFTVTDPLPEPPGGSAPHGDDATSHDTSRDTGVEQPLD